METSCHALQNWTKLISQRHTNWWNTNEEVQYNALLPIFLFQNLRRIPPTRGLEENAAK